LLPETLASGKWRRFLWRSLTPSLSNKNVLIVADNQAAQNVRADVLRNHGVEVHCAKDSVEAALLWVPDFFNLVLLDMRHEPKDALAFWRTIRRQDPKQRIFFLVGPPHYISATCPDEVLGSKAPANKVYAVRIVASA
jgi:CheY-like chemotaxis protein